jgi:hypothetical protein
MRYIKQPPNLSPAGLHRRGSTGGNFGGFFVSMSQNPIISIHRLSMYPRKPKDPEWREKYHAHLDSRKWQDLRDKVIERQKCICAGCEAAPVEHVHHLTYAHMGDEFLFELLGLCIDCHLKLHDRHPNDRQGLK